jgi:hypothetical protein
VVAPAIAGSGVSQSSSNVEFKRGKLTEGGSQTVESRVWRVCALNFLVDSYWIVERSSFRQGRTATDRGRLSPLASPVNSAAPCYKVAILAHCTKECDKQASKR